jgi:hypothetical protein
MLACSGGSIMLGCNNGRGALSFMRKRWPLAIALAAQVAAATAGQAFDLQGHRGARGLAR